MLFRSTGIELAVGIEACTGAGCTAANALNIDSGTGKINLNGVSQAGNGINAQGFQMISGKLTSANTAADAITIVGNASATNNTGWAMGVDIRGTVQTTAGGGISITGTGGTTTGASSTQSNGIALFDTGMVLSNGGAISLTGTKGSAVNSSVDIYQPGFIGQKAATDVTSSSSNITLTANTLTFHASDRLQSSGILTVKPRTAATSIGVAGGTGTLQVTASNIGTNFVDGFSNIIIGSSNAGDINVGASALNHYDPLTLKTAGSILFGSGSSFTGNNNSLILWADADNNGDGYIRLTSATTIATGGGHLWMGGGNTNGSLWNTLTVGDGYAVGNGTLSNGIHLDGAAITTNGGNVALYGKSRNGVAVGDDAQHVEGIYFGDVNSTSINSGTGKILLDGVSRGTNVWAIGIEFSSLSGAVHTITSAAVAGDAITITGDGSASSSASSSVGIWFHPNTTISATGGGNIVITGKGGTSGTYEQSLYTQGGQVNSGAGDLTLIGRGSMDLDALTLKGNGTTSMTAENVGQTVKYAISATNASNDLRGTVGVMAVTDLSLVNSTALTLGAISATGTVSALSKTGDLTLAGNIATTNATSSAVVLNAGKDSAAGTSTGGNIIISGSPSITTGAGGRVTMFTGSVSGSTGLTSFVDSGSGRFRYNSDESVANYTTALGAGKYAIYREQPAATVTAMDASKTYDGASYAGGYGVTYAALQNGDVTSDFGGSVAYTGSSQTAVDPGTYVITPGSLTSGLGYAFSFVNGTLTINKNQNTDKIVTGLTSFQDAVNGTQFDPQSANSPVGALLIGPGAGSYSLIRFLDFSPLIGSLLPQTYFRSRLVQP